MTEHYEAIVVGAGPAGCAAALELAKNGVQTLVLERGHRAGAKSATGGILYGQTNTEYNLEHVLPNFQKEAPLERPIDDYLMHCVAGDKVKTLDITRLHRHEHKWSYAVLRAKLDAYLAEKAHDATKEHGGGVLRGVRVTGPLVRDGRIVGVETEELESVTADVVIAADGATSELVRGAGLRGWGEQGQWFQGCKVVVEMRDPKTIEQRFGLAEGSGSAHLFAGDLFGGVRGGGFLYTNNDTLSIGTVFHLDSIAKGGTEPHALMDRLLLHPAVQKMLGDDAEEVEYSAKLIPDGKKMALRRPYRDHLLATGDAAGQLVAQGPVIKGMNLAITAGIIAAKSFVEARAEGNVLAAGPRYERSLKRSYMHRDLNPRLYKVSRAVAENDYMQDILAWTFNTALARRWIRKRGQKRIQGMMNSPTMASANPDIEFGYVTLPTIVAEETGTVQNGTQGFTPRGIADRIAALDYDTAVGRPHIQLVDSSPDASATAVTTCPVSARGFSHGCYRLENVVTPAGDRKNVVALDVQPCIECGTCALTAATKWTHPPGNKGVMYKFG
jgi:electron transfer flavoprotein-quinone oxidoreductase